MFVFLFLNHHYVILSKDTSDKDSAKISWWESIPVLESPPWFNGHWAFMAAIWTFDTEGCLWCTISDILYLENDLKWELPPLSIRLYTIQFAPVVCEFSSLQISCESDFLYAWIQELSSHRNDAIRSLSCCFFCFFLWAGRRVGHLSRSVIMHLQRQYLKWCNNQSLTELLITVSFRPNKCLHHTTVPGMSTLLIMNNYIIVGSGIISAHL